MALFSGCVAGSDDGFCVMKNKRLVKTFSVLSWEADLFLKNSYRSREKY